MNTPIGICGYPDYEGDMDMAMTVEEALQRADKLREQGCITPTAQALLALAEALKETQLEFKMYRSMYEGSA